MIPSLVIMCPNKFPSETAKILFLGFNEIPNFRHHLKIRFRWCKWSYLRYENTVTSFRLNTTLCPINPLKVMSMALWKFASALIKPKGMRLNANVPHIVLNVAFKRLGLTTSAWLYPENPSSKENISKPDTV